jgi:23S rRNA pseudouridine2604 synthase
MEEIQGNQGTRLNKFISEAGVASRRASDRLIEDGHVTINGRKAVLGDKVFSDSVVCVDGRQISREGEDIILAFYKPVGITCTSNPEDKDNVIDYIGYHKRIYSIGRLDKDSEGLLLLTNNGELADGIMRSRAEHEKEYLVEVNKDITPAFLKGMSEEVPIIEGKVTKRCFIEQTGPREFKIILRQGLNRQIRRMCDYFGYDVVRLVRVRIMNITIKGLKEGRHRNISKIERDELYDQLGLKK